MAVNSNQTLLRNLLRTRNFLRYTGLTYEDIVTQIVTQLHADRRFDNFKESAIAQMTLEIFAACADLLTYYMERRAEEGTIDHAKLRSSVIALAHNLAYDVQRPIPAEANIKVRLKGNIAGVSAGDRLEIPIFTPITYGGKKYLLRQTFRYTLTSSDIGQGTSFTKDIDTREIVSSSEDSAVSVIQGERITTRISGNANVEQVNQIFQRYRIDDLSFSNIHGTQDYTDGAITKVGVGTSLEEALYSADDDDNNYGPYTIDRRTLLNREAIDSFDFMSGKLKRICLVRTAKNGAVDLLFGDDKYTAKGLRSLSQNIYVEYLSTEGSRGNLTGIIGEKLSLADSVTVEGVDVTSNIELYFTTNLVNGADLEDIESIRHNAPAIYYSLDRLVTGKDYESYLKSLSSPIDIRAALAWGEQDEAALQGVDAIQKLFNVVMYTCIGALYNIYDDTSLTYSPKTSATGLDTAVLDADYSEDDISSQSYYNILTKQTVIQQLKVQDTLSTATSAYQRATGGVLATTSLAAWKTERTNLGAWDSAVISATYYDVSAEEEVMVELSASFTSAAYFANVASALYDLLVANIPTLLHVSCVYDGTNNRFKVSSVKDGTADYLVNIVDPMESLISPTYGLLLNTTSANWDEVVYVFGSAYSKKIDTVSQLLAKRQQVTVKSVYVSPIIHNMQIVGNIYIRALADKDDIHRQIRNTVYTWANESIGFNTPIDISTIIEMIESFPDVERADVKLWPLTTGPSAGTSAFFNPSTDGRAIVQANRSLFETTINTFLSATSLPFTGALSADYYRNGYTDRYLWLSWNRTTPGLTERAFYNTFAKTLYDALPATWRDNAELVSVLNDIHRDWLWTIRYNLLDSNGNIRPEYTTSIVNNATLTTRLRGGYSLGNEIVKLTMNTSPLYAV